MKDEISGKVVIKFAGFRAKFYSYLIDDRKGDKKAKGTKKCVIKRKLKFENYKNCLEATQFENKTKNKTERIHGKQEINIKNTAKI